MKKVTLRHHVFWLLVHPRERWRTIVMSTSVCQSVCLSVHPSVKISLKPHMRSLPIFLCMLPMAMALVGT